MTPFVWRPPLKRKYASSPFPLTLPFAWFGAGAVGYAAV